MEKLTSKIPKYVGDAGRETRSSMKRERVIKALELFRGGLTIQQVAGRLDISPFTAKQYRRNLIREGKFVPRNMMSKIDRMAFMKANIHQSVEWHSEQTGIALSTIARELKQLGRKDIKLSDYVNDGKSSNRGTEHLYREYKICDKWNSVYRAMTAKQQVVL